jgi:hypothetical protein
MGSTVGSVVAFVREVRLPVGIHLLALLIEVPGGREFAFAHLRGSVHGGLGGVEHEQVPGRGDLEVPPGDRNLIFIESENPAPGDHQIGDLACPRTHHNVLDAAESLVLRSAHADVEQLVGPE